MVKKKALKKIQKLAKEKKIVFAPTNQVALLHPWIARIMEAMGIEKYFVSDESTIGDFHLDREELQQLKTNLGVVIKKKDYIVEVAKRLQAIDN